MYLRNRSVPSGSNTSSRGRLGSSGVSTTKTDESIERNLPPGLALLKISAKKRGLTVLSESQQGMRKATGLLPGIWFIRSTQPWYVRAALAKSPFCRQGQG